jgi:hypothetical protein
MSPAMAGEVVAVAERHAGTADASRNGTGPGSG